jgi:hypothetical protein
MTTISEHYRDNEEEGPLLDSPRESLEDLSYDVERGDNEAHVRWQTTRYKYKIFVLAASTIVTGLFSGVNLSINLALLVPPPVLLQVRAISEPGQLPKISPALAGAMLASFMPTVVPFILIPLYKKVGIGGALVAGIIGVFIAHVFASFHLGDVAFAIGSAIGNLGSALFLLTLSIWMCIQTSPYALVGVITGLYQFWSFVGVKLATVMSDHSWSISHFYQISAPFAMALIPCFWLAFRDENPSKYTSTYSNELGFRESFKVNSVWLFALTLGVATGLIAMIVPGGLSWTLGSQPISPDYNSTFILFGSLGHIIIGCGINALNQQHQHRAVSYLIPVASLFVLLFGVVRAELLKSIFYSLVVFCISPISSFLFILAASILQKDHYVQAVRSALVGSIAVSVGIGLLTGIVLTLLTILVGAASSVIVIVLHLVALYFCYHRALKQTPE